MTLTSQDKIAVTSFMYSILVYVLIHIHAKYDSNAEQLCSGYIFTKNVKVLTILVIAAIFNAKWDNRTHFWKGNIQWPLKIQFYFIWKFLMNFGIISLNLHIYNNNKTSKLQIWQNNTKICYVTHYHIHVYTALAFNVVYTNVVKLFFKWSFIE